MIFRALPLLLIAFSLCQCQSQRTTVEEAQGMWIGDSATSAAKEAALTKKFAGNWRPEDASWGSASGETDPKKKAENDKKSRRSQFEKSVTRSRENALFTKSTQWQERSFTRKEFSTGPEKKSRIWPWSKKTAATKQSDLVKTDSAQNQVSRDAGVAAQEHSLKSPDNSTQYGTDTYATQEHGAAQRRFTKAETSSAHREPNIIQDRNEASKQESGLSIQDLRKMLNK